MARELLRSHGLGDDGLPLAATVAERHHPPDVGACDPEEAPCDGCAATYSEAEVEWAAERAEIDPKDQE